MSLADLLATKSLILIDGAMGTQLAEAGLEMGGHNCIFHPKEVLSVHEQYSKAGCNLLITNTLTMNGISIDKHKIDVDVKEVNLSGARLAKAAATSEQYILGDISSTGQLLEPYGDYSEEQFYTTFKEQAEYLLAGGVDGFMIETMMDAREALCALRACRDVSQLPVLVTLSFQTIDKGGRTLMGNSAKEIAVALEEAGAAGIGANCGDLDPHETAVIVGIMRECVDLSLIAQPNAGKPSLIDGQTVYDMSPEDFTEGIAECIAAGASIVGGCCGTTPEHIRCVAEWLRWNTCWKQEA
ncbi:MAG: homocysteine S-methyltransferase family protein [Spirochaetales bacterium]|nr:homocysteine S-methyltransferase family protein [Spirochaetales bacterium]